MATASGRSHVATNTVVSPICRRRRIRHGERQRNVRVMCQEDVQDDNLLVTSCKAFGVYLGVQRKLPRAARMVDRNEEWQTSGGRRRSSQEDCEDCNSKIGTSNVIVRRSEAQI